MRLQEVLMLLMKQVLQLVRQLELIPITYLNVIMKLAIVLQINQAITITISEVLTKGR